MDVKREGVGKRKAIRRVVYLTLTLVAVVLIGWRVSLMKPAVPVVEASTVWPDVVKRGPMQVCGSPDAEPKGQRGGQSYGEEIDHRPDEAVD